VRPAVSVGRTATLDEFDASHNFSHLSNLGGNPPHDFGGYFNLPEPTESDRLILENGILPIADSFDLNYGHLAGDNDNVLDDFNINDFLHHDEITQPAPEVQSSDSLAETTASLQPQLGASSYGCDDGGNAVSV